MVRIDVQCSLVLVAGLFESLFYEAGRLRTLGFQITGITSFSEDVINTTQRDIVYLSQTHTDSKWPSWDSDTPPWLQNLCCCPPHSLSCHTMPALKIWENSSPISAALLCKLMCQVLSAVPLWALVHLDHPPTVCDCPSSLSPRTGHRTLCVVWQT